MWNNSDPDYPGCVYDTVDCSDCRGCCVGEPDKKTPLDCYLEDMDE